MMFVFGCRIQFLIIWVFMDEENNITQFIGGTRVVTALASLTSNNFGLNIRLRIQARDFDDTTRLGILGY